MWFKYHQYSEFVRKNFRWRMNFLVYAEKLNVRVRHNVILFTIYVHLLPLTKKGKRSKDLGRVDLRSTCL